MKELRRKTDEENYVLEMTFYGLWAKERVYMLPRFIKQSKLRCQEEKSGKHSEFLCMCGEYVILIWWMIRQIFNADK